jgi:chromosome segregation ATPase
MKKGLLYIAVLSLVFVGCNNNKPQTNIVTAQQTDSLQKILAQKDNEINDMMGTLNDINEGFREINEAENRVALAKQGEGTDMTQRIKENIMFIQTTMKQNRELISKLKEQLRESSFNSVQLKRTIINLTKQLDAKDQQLQQLRAELDAKDIHISELDETIANLNTNVSSLTDESNQKTQTINNQDKHLNSAWFVFGTKKELKEQHIIEDGKVLQASFNKNYFTKIDIRVDKDIKLYSKYAKLLTTHPAGSYSIQRDASDQFILHISNPQSFWSTSKYLVILVK